MLYPRQILFLFLFIACFWADEPKKKEGKEEKKKENKKWNVETPLGPTKEIEFWTDEGTWMNLDISPDGRQLAFDLFGDIYLLPIEGGEATLIAGGPAFEVQPRFSPDGKHISYTSDKDGADNIWIMKTDGSESYQVTKEDFRLLNNACWTPDGQYLVAKKHFTSHRSLGAGEMWLYHISGGKGLQMTTRKNDQQDVGEPWVSPDGRYVYFSEDMSQGGYFEYNKDPHGQIYVIRRVDRETGHVRNIISGPGGAVRPQISPDGNTLAFIRRVRTKTVLFLHDLKTGQQEMLYDELNKDQQETWATFGVYPNFNWTPDGQHLIVWAKGKIWKISVKDKKATLIPFKAKVKQTLNQVLRFSQKIDVPSFESKMIRQGTVSPDGKWYVFNAVGYLWKKELPEGKPQRLTQDKHFEYWPSFSADGQWIVYSTWGDKEYGAIYKTKLDGSIIQKVTAEKGFYREPSFSNDSSKILYRRVKGDALLGFNYGTNPGIYWIDADGKGKSHLIREKGRTPRFNKEGTRIYFIENKGPKKALISSNLLGGEERTHFTSKYATHFLPSPDEKWLAFTELYHCYLVPFSKAGKPIELSGNTNSLPLQKLTDDVGTSLSWAGDSNSLSWLMGSKLMTLQVKEQLKWGGPKRKKKSSTKNDGNQNRFATKH